MPDIWNALIPILLADVLNPVLFGFLVYAAGSDRPVLYSSAALIGHTVAYFAAGIVLSYGLESISERLANPKQIDFFIELLIGLALLVIAVKSRSAEKKAPEQNLAKLTLGLAFGFGIVINFVGIPFAVPYFAAISQILKADLSIFQSLYILMGYNLLYALPFCMVPILVAGLGARSRPLLEKFNGLLDRLSSAIMPIILALVGVALVADALVYFVTRQPLF